MAQTYIVGDIVMYKNRIHTIIDTLGLNNYELSYIRHQVNRAELSGVPLTPEILEKNGWSREDGAFGVSPDFKKIIDNPARKKGYITYLSVYPFFDNDGFNFFYNNQKLATIHYVHELQHILFGLNINHEMEV